MNKDEGVPCTIRIRRNSDGVTRVCCPDMLFDGEFIWSEGNYACDCNRALFFERAAGIDDPEVECGDTAYSVQITRPCGLVLYQDESWMEPTPEVKP